MHDNRRLDNRTNAMFIVRYERKPRCCSLKLMAKDMAKCQVELHVQIAHFFNHENSHVTTNQWSMAGNDSALRLQNERAIG
nr:hypothetical protein CFP56_25886 [Quercus suber]